MDNPDDVTRLLRRWQNDGDTAAEDELFTLVQNKLLQIARRSLVQNSGFDHKVDPQELVSEAYLRVHNVNMTFENRRPFYALVARVMRNALMDLARHDRAAKRPSTRLRVVDTEAVNGVAAAADCDVFEFYEAIDALQAINPEQAQAIEWRILGYTTDEISEAGGRSTASVTRDLRHAKAFIAQRLGLGAEWVVV